MFGRLYEQVDSPPSSHYLSYAADDLYPLIEREKQYLARKSWLFVLYTSLGILLFILVIGINMEISPGLAVSQHLEDHGHCGQSSSEAKARGCKFDIMSFSWLKPECYDHELAEDFSRLRDWQWFLDGESELEVAEEVVRQGDHGDLFVSMEYHLFHCTYMWRKLHRSLEWKAKVDSYIGNYNHTVHCEHMLLMRDAMMKDRNTVIRVKYSRCDESL